MLSLFQISRRSLLQPISTCVLQRVSLSYTRLPSRRFISSTHDSLDNTAPERNILEHLRDQKRDKWGWVVYRTTYNDDEAWIRFKRHINAQAHRDITESDNPELENSLEWTFIDHRASLEGASVPQLREHFKTWTAKTFNFEQPRIAAKNISNEDFIRFYGSPWYTSFIQVDEESLQSMIEEWEQPDLEGTGHVNLVQAYWKSMKEEQEKNGGEDFLEDEEEDYYEPIDGCREEDVGWMRMASTMMNADFYEEIGELWHIHYRRPPDIAYVF